MSQVLPLASIIIPVYNSEEHLQKCLDSILKQTYTNFEIIIINDGSNDGSQKIIEDFAQRDPKKILFYSQKNSGISVTRNKGIEYSKGKYIFFIDNDDFISENYIETFITQAENENADMVIGGYKRIEEKGRLLHSFLLKNTEWDAFRLQAPWARVYRKKFLLENNLIFLDTKVGEDSSLNIPAAIFAKKIITINYAGYYWVNVSKSVSNTEQKKILNAEHVILMLKYIYNKINPDSLTKEKYSLLEYFYIKYSIWFLLFSGRKSGTANMSSAYSDIFKNLKELFPNYLKNQQISMFKPKGERFSVRAIIFFAVIMKKAGILEYILRIYSKI